ncbi:MAG TPA: CBS domain-containing protein, partial [Candidatus Handelsmanbacteria bacterium]|nr:CBS domain-containing protein [Candidatus Handelsmanbacteria bacterium]
MLDPGFDFPGPAKTRRRLVNLSAPHQHPNVRRGEHTVISHGISLGAPLVTSRYRLDLGEAEGTVEENAGEMLENIFRFGEMEVRDVMTPRPEIIWIRADATFGEFMDAYRVSPHTRFPVFDTDHDDVVGIFSVKDVLASLSEAKLDLDHPVINLMRQANFVPETKRLDDL